MVSTHYLFLTSLLAALNLSTSVIARSSVTTKPPIKSAWREYWKAAELPIANISWYKYTSMTWTFAGVSSDCKITIDPSGTSDLSAFVEAAHNNSVKALVSVGGADNSTYFSPCLSTNETSQNLVNSVVNFTETYQLDGIEFSWLSPNMKEECNQFSPNDTAHYLAFLTNLWEVRPPNMTITLAVGSETYVDSSGIPMTNMSAWAEVVDYITIQGYDFFSPKWSPTVGPNSPLNYDSGSSCATPQNVSFVGSVAAGVNTWVDAGFGSDQIVMGVASYGHGYNVSLSNALDSESGKIELYPVFNGIPYGSNDYPAGSPFYQMNDSCGKLNTQSGTYDFSGMIRLGYLTANGTSATGIDYLFDNCSQTPYLYIPDDQIMISYDDAASFADKGSFIKQHTLRGFSMWHVEGDYYDILFDAINSTMS